MGGKWSSNQIVVIKERMKSKVTAEGMKLLPARFGWNCLRRRERSLWNKKKKMVKREREKKEGRKGRNNNLLFQEVKEKVAGTKNN